MTEVKDIIFDDYWYNEFCDETEIYFEAPKSYLYGEYPEADGCTFVLRYPGIEWNIDNAAVWISPFKDDEDTKSDYDWRPSGLCLCIRGPFKRHPCGKEFKQALYDIFGNHGKENS